MKKKFRSGRGSGEREQGTEEKRKKHSGGTLFSAKKGSPAPSQKTLKLLYVKLECTVLSG